MAASTPARGQGPVIWWSQYDFHQYRLGAPGRQVLCWILSAPTGPFGVLIALLEHIHVAMLFKMVAISSALLSAGQSLNLRQSTPGPCHTPLESRTLSLDLCSRPAATSRGLVNPLLDFQGLLEVRQRLVVLTTEEYTAPRLCRAGRNIVRQVELSHDLQPFLKVHKGLVIVPKQTVNKPPYSSNWQQYSGET